jgi:hypothetical protein
MGSGLVANDSTWAHFRMIFQIARSPLSANPRAHRPASPRALNRVVRSTRDLLVR